MYFILVDSGRTSVLGSDVREALRCIRCGACMNHCPVYQNIGGHAYGWVYPGPIGSILTPMYVGLENALDLPQASTFCNQCGVVCPVKIPLPDLQRKLREREFREHLRPWSERAGLKLWAWFARRPALYAFASRLGVRFLRRLRGSDGMIHQLPLGHGLDAGTRHARARRAHVPRAVRTAQRRSDERTAYPTSRMPQLSRRAESLGTENAFVVLAEVNALARAGKDIVSFCIGQPDFPTPPNVQDAAIEAIRGGKHGYTPSAGIDELRVAAAKDLGTRRGLDIAPDDVVVGAGAKPFIAYTIASVTDYGAGDEVIYPVPGFPIYESQILANGAVPVPIFLREARSFAFDPAELEAKITPKTRLLILNTPQNPTGGILDHADLDAIAEILRAHPQVWVFADEIYSRLVYDGKLRFARDAPRHARADDHQRRRVQDVGHDRMAHRLRRESRRWRRCSRAGSRTPSRARRRFRNGRRWPRSPDRRKPPTTCARASSSAAT